MSRPMETYRGEHFFQRDQLLYVNRSSEDFSVPYHDHDFLECAYIAEGTGFHHIGETVQKVHRGQFFFIPIGMSHVFRPTSTDKTGRPLNVYNCVFSTLLLHKLLAFTADPTVASFIRQMESGSLGYFTFQDKDDRFERIFQALHKQYSLPLAGASDYLHTLLLQLIIELSRSTELEEQTPAPKEAAFNDLLHYLDDHLEQELTLAHLALVSSFSERHLQRLFHRHTGQSWNRYLQNIRIQKSRELLRGTPYKISTIAEMVGYKDIHSFNTVFKRCTGMTPSMYRKEIKLK